MTQPRTAAPTHQPRLLLPEAPALVAGFGRGALLTPDGELLTLPAAEIGRRLRDMAPPLLVHGPATWKRLGLPPGPACDLLELFAFCRPAQPAAPTPRITDLDVFPVIDSQGLVNPLVPAGAAAHVFAVLDDKRRVQYIGYSAGLRTTLRTLLGRRPDKAHFYK